MLPGEQVDQPVAVVINRRLTFDRISDHVFDLYGDLCRTLSGSL
jgi:hypothetical protein